MKHIEVVAAIIVNEDKILCVQRGLNKYDYISNKFEFPGGKIKQGETKEEALKREIQEELKIIIEIEREFMTIYHEYPDFNLTMHSFICRCKDVALTLTEHINYLWLSKHDLTPLDWAAADIHIIEKLTSL